MSAIPNIPQAVVEKSADTQEFHDKRDPKLIDTPVESANHADHKSINSTDDVNHTKHHTTTNFTLYDKPVENFRPIKVIVIGAGFSGIYLGIRIPERFRNCELVIYDKNAGIGGTWYENRYPGCACDVPSHSYQYSFNPNPDWSALYAPSHEICKYLEDTADKYSVRRFIKLQHEIIDCRYDQTEAKWHVKIKLPDGSTFEDTSDILISAKGGLNDVAWPTIDGLRQFKGEMMHSATWNESYDFSNKRIGIIGSGSSAIQIIPQLQKRPDTKLKCFIRGKTWISPSFAQNIQDELGMKSFTFDNDQRRRFRDDPKHFYEFRRMVEQDAQGVHAITIRGTELQKGAQEIFRQNMKDRLSKKPELFDKLVPDFSPGCRRLTPGPGFLEALSEDNVSFISDSISKIEPDGVRTADGQLHEVDVLVCATGFHTASAPPFPVTGLNNATLKSQWSNRADNYLSLATHNFPNYFIMLGPNAAIGSGSLTLMIESVGDYIMKCMRKFQRENIRSMTVKQDRVKDFIRYVDAYFARTVFTDECRSWYRTGDKITGLWPGSTLHCIESLRSPRWEDYEYEYIPTTKGEEVNQMAWLGNGWSINQLEDNDKAWYIRPEFVSVPNAPLPEENELLKVRAFSN